MIGTDGNHCKIVQESLSGERGVDERTFESLAVLKDRLERVRELGYSFSEIGFSPAVKKLAKQGNVVLVG